MAQVILNKIKQQLTSGAYDMISDFMKDHENMTKEEMLEMDRNMLSVVYDVQKIDNWDTLIQMMNEDKLSILGYPAEEGMELLMSDIS